jgi:hypothetical protein
MHGNEQAIIDNLAQWLRDEFEDKKKHKADPSNWSTVASDTPCQRNGYDCGVFMNKVAHYRARDIPLSFDQSSMPYFRRRMVLEILNCQLLDDVITGARNSGARTGTGGAGNEDDQSANNGEWQDFDAWQLQWAIVASLSHKENEHIQPLFDQSEVELNSRGEQSLECGSYGDCLYQSSARQMVLLSFDTTRQMELRKLLKQEALRLWSHDSDGQNFLMAAYRAPSFTEALRRMTTLHAWSESNVELQLIANVARTNVEVYNSAGETVTYPPDSTINPDPLQRPILLMHYESYHYRARIPLDRCGAMGCIMQDRHTSCITVAQWQVRADVARRPLRAVLSQTAAVVVVRLRTSSLMQTTALALTSRSTTTTSMMPRLPLPLASIHCRVQPTVVVLVLALVMVRPMTMSPPLTTPSTISFKLMRRTYVTHFHLSGKRREGGNGAAITFVLMQK